MENFMGPAFYWLPRYLFFWRVTKLASLLWDNACWNLICCQNNKSKGLKPAHKISSVSYSLLLALADKYFHFQSSEFDHNFKENNWRNCPLLLTYSRNIHKWPRIYTRLKFFASPSILSLLKLSHHVSLLKSGFRI